MFARNDAQRSGWDVKDHLLFDLLDALDGLYIYIECDTNNMTVKGSLSYPSRC